MASTFTWLDYSEHDRRKMADVISSFREQDTRDEIGIGSIRDAIADILFPGTSTVQTRAGYFLFVPWMYLALEKKKVPSAQAAQWARDRESVLISSLGNVVGNIGHSARDKLKRLPSSVYWQGLRLWGIRRYSESQDQYHRSLDGFYGTRGRSLHSDDGDRVTGFAEPNWHAGLPHPPDRFPWDATFRLRAVDSDYLKSRILLNVGKSLLAHFADQDSPFVATDFVWESERYDGFPPEIRRCVDHARCFSETIHGAALLYNLMLAQKADFDDSVDHYEREIESWIQLMHDRKRVLSVWNHEEFWATLDRADARVPLSTKAFVTHWLDRAVSMPDADRLIADQELRRLIHDRERALKRGQARLDNPRALELWSGAAGTGRLDFRWGKSKVILTDILEGLRNA